MRRDASTSASPFRVLQVVGGMGRGGLDGWLIDVLRRIDQDRFRMDFLIYPGAPNAYAEEIQDLGSQSIYCADPSHPLKHARNFARVLQEHGPYHIVHSHIHHASGFYLRWAKQAGVPARIVHSHLDDSSLLAAAGHLRRLYQGLMGRWIEQHATAGLATSRQAAAALFGPAWEEDPRWRLLYCGIDVAPYRSEHDRGEIRREFGVADDELLVGHVGRFVYQKNHPLLLAAMAEIVRAEPRARLLMVGDGPLRPEVEGMIAELGLADIVISPGIRTDVPRLMRAMDVFLFPSRYEGLGLVLLEAQACGVPCVLSDVIPPEADLLPELSTRVPLQAHPVRWAEVVLEASRLHPLGALREEAYSALERGPFDIRVSVEQLETVYAASQG